MDLPETTTVELSWGPIGLKLEQVANLGELAEASLRAQTDPYWGYIWPSARALMGAVASLAQQIAPDDPRTALAGTRVLDLGCGPGGIGVLAAMLGADATLVDRRPEALALAQRNATLNDVQITTVGFDWATPPPDLGSFEAILAADILYGDGMLSGVLRFIKAHLAPTGRAVIADPMRIEPAGIVGAARLRGFDVQSRIIQPGPSHTGGVTLHTITSR